MEAFRLQIGCLAVLIYVAVVYAQGCARYHVKITASHFWEFLVVGVFTVVFDGATAWIVGNPGVISPVWSYVFHGLSFIGLDATIFFLSVYVLRMMERYPKKREFLLYLPLLVNIVLIAATIGIGDYLSGKEDAYTSGLAIIICFVMIGLYLSFTFLPNSKYFNQIKSEKQRGIITFLFAYAIISMIQIIFPDAFASMSIGVTILVLGIYLNSEDPAIKELGRYYTETVMSFANLIEERDGSTGGHIKRTSRYAAMIVENCASGKNIRSF